jgi:hypothetical protein
MNFDRFRDNETKSESLSNKEKQRKKKKNILVDEMRCYCFFVCLEMKKQMRIAINMKSVDQW